MAMVRALAMALEMVGVSYLKRKFKMQFQYRQIDKNLLWDLDMINKVSLENIDKLYKMVKKSFALKAYDHFSESFSKERLKLINNILSYLSIGFRCLDSALQEDNRKIAYLALLELLDYTIKTEDVQFRVKECCQYLRFKYKKMSSPIYGSQFYIATLQYDVVGSGELEKATLLPYEEPYTCFSDLIAENLYKDKSFNLVKTKVYPFYPYVCSLSNQDKITSKTEIDENKWDKSISQYKLQPISSISFFQARRIFQFEAQKTPVLLDINNFTQMEMK
jgi:hypothetical protein